MRQRHQSATAVVSDAAGACPALGQQPGQGLLTGTTTKVGWQTDTAQAKGTLTSSMKQGRLED
jgi:hypothetical protein